MEDESRGKVGSHPPRRPDHDDTPTRPLTSARTKRAQQQQRKGCRRRRGTTAKGDKDSPLTHPEPDRPYEEKIVFTFVSPWGLANPLTRAYSRLLGPCFKTGRGNAQPTRRGVPSKPLAKASQRAVSAAGEPARRPAFTGAGGPFRNPNRDARPDDSARSSARHTGSHPVQSEGGTL